MKYKDSKYEIIIFVMSAICLDFCMSSFMEVKMCPVNKQVARKKERQ